MTLSCCDICNDTGYIFYTDNRGYEYVKPCNCRILAESEARFKKSGLADGFRTKSFENFATADNPKLVDAKTTAENFTSGVIEAKNQIAEEGKISYGSLLLCGQPGAGKTHLGTASSMKIIDAGIPVIYMSYREEIIKLKQSVTDDSYDAKIGVFKSCDVLFIDDFLKGRITESDVNIMYEIINFRYNKKLPTIVSTEKDLKGILDFDEAIGSRLIEMSRGHIISFDDKELNFRIFGGGKRHGSI